MRRPVLATDRVRFIGEPVAVVVAETRALAVDASELVDIDYRAARRADRPGQGARRRRAAALRGRQPGRAQGPPGEEALDGAEVTVGGRFINQRLAAVPMEPGASIAAPDPETGGFILWTPTQGPHGPRDGIASALGLEPDKLRVISPGHRRRLRRAHLGLPGADRDRRRRPQARPRRALHRDALGDDARHAARPRAGAGRDHRRHARRADHRAEGARDRRLRRLSRRRVADADADRADVLRRLRHPEGRLPLRLRGHQHDADRRLPRRRAPGGHGAGRARGGHVRGRARDGPGRGAPAQLHLASFPHQTVTGANYDSGEYAAALEKALAQRGLRPTAGRAGGAARARRQPAARASGCAATWSGPASAPSSARCKVEQDGTVTVRSGASSHGQGHETAYAQLVAGTLGVPSRRRARGPVRHGQGGARHGHDGLALAAGRRHGGPERHRRGAGQGAAARRPPARGRRAATSRSCRARASAWPARPRRRSRGRELAQAAADPARRPEGMDDGLSAEHDWETPDATYPFGTHLAVVEVDVETGSTKLVRHVTVDDAGRIAQPAARRGPGARRHRPGRGPGAVRGDRLRRGRQLRHRLAGLLRDAERVRPAELRDRAHPDADRRATRWARRASARRARSAPRPRCGTR